MRPSHSDIRDDWHQRQQEHGNQPRAVLMKGLHPLINESIDSWHRDVMRAAFAACTAPASGARILDLGCGFGRLADEITRLGHVPVGLDFTQQFCVGFAAAHGMAVCGDQTALPFVDGAFGGAYSVTSLMYLDRDEARSALLELDRCLGPDGLILVLEPCREFNQLVRTLLPKKRGERLAMPGFSRHDFHDILPSNWIPFSAGDCRWMTRALPLLALATRWPGAYGRITALIRRLDRPDMRQKRLRGKMALYRWVACRKSR